MHTIIINLTLEKEAGHGSAMSYGFDSGGSPNHSLLLRHPINQGGVATCKEMCHRIPCHRAPGMTTANICFDNKSQPPCLGQRGGIFCLWCTMAGKG